MASDSIPLYNVYIVYFKQTRGPSHEAIALVPEYLPSQSEGRFYHVKGVVGLGMDYECRPKYKFAVTRTFKDKTYQFKLPKSYLPSFEHIASTQPPPYDPRALTERVPIPPVRDCATWVSEVLDATKTLLVDNGSSV